METDIEKISGRYQEDIYRKCRNELNMYLSISLSILTMPIRIDIYIYIKYFDFVVSGMAESCCSGIYIHIYMPLSVSVTYICAKPIYPFLTVQWVQGI